MAQVSGSLITRNYNNFSGVDFSKFNISLYRSPDALNMWKNYKNSGGKSVETRPDIELLEEHSDTIFGFFFYTYNGKKHRILHCGTKLYDDNKVIFEGMKRNKSIYFIYGNKLYILDSSSYLVYDGNSIKEVEGYIPRTTISKSPSGAGTVYEDVNLLTGVRKNSYVGDGQATEYVVDAVDIDTDYKVKVWVNDEELTQGFTVNYEEGKVVFTKAPSEPLTVGQDNVIIQFRKTIKGYRERIVKCTLVEIFDNRVFFSGNPDYPNILWHCSLDDPSYCSDLDYYEEGTNDAKVKSIVTGNNALWVLKEPNQSNTTIFYHNPTIDSDYGKVYPSTHSSINAGCATTGVNFKDTICFFSERGLEGITGDVTTEQAISHKSSYVDAKLLNEDKYKEMILAEWEGYLLVIVGNKIYLADSRVREGYEYEWFYWEFDIDIKGALVKDGVLYLYSDKNIYTLTKTDSNIQSYWTTLEDEFGYPQYQKTTNKKGCIVNLDGSDITVFTKTDNEPYELINTYKNTKGYVVPRIKKKKWKDIQLKFHSTKPFSIYSITLESYVGSYVKR